MANKIVLKKSSVAAKVPTTSDIDYGELALNYQDGKLYYKTANNTIDSFNSASASGVSSITATSPIVRDQSSGPVTISHAASGVTAGSYGSNALIPTITVDSTGHVTSVTTSTVRADTYATTATAAGTTTLTASSAYRQVFTGTTTQTVVLPVTSTLSAGVSFEIENNSTGNLTVNSSGGNLVITVIPNTCAHVLCIGTTLTTAADWDADFISFSAVTGTGNNVLSASPTFTGTVSVSALSASSTLTANSTFTASSTVTLSGSTSSTTSVGTSATTGTTLIGGTSQTGTITLGRSTVAQTIEIATGATAASTTKTVNIGANGTSTSTTNITLGSSVSGALGTITLNHDAVTRGSITQASGATSIANQAVVQAIVATTAQTAIDTFAIATYRSAKYVVQITQGTNYQVSEILVIHNGTTTTMTEYGMMNTNGVLATFATDISTTNARLLVTMGSATSSTINITRTTIVV